MHVSTDTMIALKCVLEILSFLFLWRCITPPNIAHEKKGDKVISEGILMDYVSWWVWLAQTTLLITTLFTLSVLILSTSYFNGSAYSIENDLYEWFLLDALFYSLVVVGYTLREWSYSTLDRLFTFELAIRSDHQLIQSGPYKYCRHPSYTAMVFALLGHVYFHIYRPQLVYMVWIESLFYPWFMPWIGSLVFYGLSHLLTYSLVYTALIMLPLLAYRVAREEDVLQSEFGEEWDVYTSKTRLFIPFLL